MDSTVESDFGSSDLTDAKLMVWDFLEARQEAWNRRCLAALENFGENAKGGNTRKQMRKQYSIVVKDRSGYQNTMLEMGTNATEVLCRLTNLGWIAEIVSCTPTGEIEFE
jgi:hypothetical protein